LIDVGAGFGTFGEEALAAGFSRVIAIEPTPVLAQSCRARGLEVIELPIESVDPSALQADVLTAFEVVEHLYSPSAFLQKCLELMAPGALLFLSCPNIEGFDLVVLGEISDTIDLEHLNYFTTTSLPMLCERAGLEVLDVATPGELDAELVRKKALLGEFSLEGQDFLRLILLDGWTKYGDAFQSFLVAQNLSSHLWLVARKPT
jgi:SAM-dependent methyltransferase